MPNKIFDSEAPSDNILVEDFGKYSSALIIFSSVNSNGYSFYKNTIQLPCVKIYARDPFDQWYQKGINEYLPSVDSIVDYLNSILRSSGVQKVVTMGSSMGAYAALLFGIKIRATEIIAMSPQTVLDSRLPHTPTIDYKFSEYFDISALVRTKNRHRPKVNLIFGSDDIIDVWNATRIKLLSGDFIFPVAGQDHLAAAALSSRGDLHRLVTSVLSGGSVCIESRSDNLCLDARIVRIVDSIVRAVYLDESSEEPELLAKRLRKLRPDWAVPYGILTELSLNKNDIKQAARYSESAYNRAPQSISFATIRANILMRMKKDEEAITAFNICLSLRSKHYAALCGLGEIYTRNNRRSEAEVALKKAIEIRPRLSRAKELLAILDGGHPARGFSDQVIVAEDM